MRILILTPDFPLWDGGVAAVAENLADFLQRAGQHVTVFTPTQTPHDAAFDDGQKYRVIRLRNLKDRFYKYFLGHWRLRSLLIRERFDCILATNWFPYAPIAVACAPNTPLFVCVYGNDFLETRWRRPFWHRRMVRALEGSQLLLAGSVGSAEAIGEFWPPAKNKTVVLTPAVDPDEFFVTAPATSPSPPILLTLARLVERKGQDMVLRALPLILNEFPQTQYWIGGRGSDLSRLQKLVADFGIQNNVRFLGFVPREERVKLYQQCAIYLMPSRSIGEKGDFEAFGITFLEANACGKPVIGGRSGGVTDAVLDGVTGLLVDPCSPEEIAEKTLQLLRHPADARQLGQQGRQRIERELNWKVTVQKLLALVQHGKA